MKTPTHYFAATCSRTEEPLNQYVAPDSKMRRHIRKNSGERADLNRIVIWNRDMMLAAFVSAQPQVATCLPRRSITQGAQCLGKIRSRNVSRQFHLWKEAMSTGSTGQHFVAHKMQANDLGRSALIKMATYRVADLLPECVQSFRFRKDRLAQGACSEPAFYGFFYEKNDFVHVLLANANSDCGTFGVLEFLGKSQRSRSR
jgi:hypothetical protein